MGKTRFVALVILWGCSVGPKYHQPKIETAADYKNAEGGLDSEDPSYISLSSWWKQFEDPVLDQIIDQAIQKNYNLLIAFERIKQVRAYYNIQTSNLFPTLDFNGTFSRYATSQNLFDSPFLGPRVQNLFQLGFDVQWEIDLFGRLRNLKNAALMDLFATKEDFQSLYITILADVARNYTLYRAFEKKLNNLKKQVQVRTLINELNLSLAKSGLESWEKYYTTRAEIRAIEAKIPQLEMQVQYANNRIAVLIGEQPENFSLKGEGEILAAKGRVPLGLPSDLLRRRPDIRQKERELAAATHRTAAAVADFFPTFSLSGSYGWEASRFYKWFRPQSSYWDITPGLTLPLINFGRIQAQVDLKYAEQKELFYDYQNVVLQALEEVENNLFTYLQQQVKITTLDLEVHDFFESYQLALSRFQSGLSPLSEALLQEWYYLGVEYEWIEANQVLSEGLIAIYKSLGGDWECSSTP
jgi:NodT family efflux transporter outer membrane factor (OMF) lipoprotein